MAEVARDTRGGGFWWLAFGGKGTGGLDQGRRRPAGERMRVMTRLAAIATLAASPAFAADKPPLLAGQHRFRRADRPFSSSSGILIYFKVPGILAGMLDKRAEGIRSDLDEARSLREGGSGAFSPRFERKSAEVKEQADRIVAAAKSDAGGRRPNRRSATSDAFDRPADQGPPRTRSPRPKPQRCAGCVTGRSRRRPRRLPRFWQRTWTGTGANTLFDEALETVKAKLH